MDEKEEEAQPGSAAGHEFQEDHRMPSLAENMAGGVHVFGGRVYFEGERKSPSYLDKCLQKLILGVHSQIQREIDSDAVKKREEEVMLASEKAFLESAGPVLFLSSVLPKQVTILREEKRVRVGQNEYRLRSRLEHFEECMVRVENKGEEMFIKDFFVGQRRLMTKSSLSPTYVYSELSLKLAYLRKARFNDLELGAILDLPVSLDVYGAHMIELEFVEDEKILPRDLLKPSF